MPPSYAAHYQGCRPPRIALLLLDRPERLNTINDAMPREIRAAVGWTAAEDKVHVIHHCRRRRQGICGGYDFNYLSDGDIDHICLQENFRGRHG